MLLLFSLLIFNTPPLQMDVEAFKHFKKEGTKPYCMVDYEKKTISCIYDTMNECRDKYDNDRMGVCFTRKSLKLGDEQ
jgi:hypothetical protein